MPSSVPRLVEIFGDLDGEIERMHLPARRFDINRMGLIYMIGFPFPCVRMLIIWKFHPY